jgi:KaiC/GvpD/RAD55 family RecA-like ATPase
MDAILDKIPHQLTGLDQWVCWRKVTRDGKDTKLPVQPNGEPASSTDPQTWNAIFECVDAADKFAGIGFVFSKHDPYIGIDLDGCVDESGRLQEWAKEVVLQLGSYAEISPSGTGVKIFCTTESPWEYRNKKEVEAEKITSKQPGIEIYDCGRYFAVTGKRLKDLCEIKPLAANGEWLAEKFGLRYEQPVVSGYSLTLETPVSERASKYVQKMPPSISGQSGHNKCFAAACALVKGFELTENESLRILLNEFNPRCQPPWSERELAHKVRQATRQPGASGYLRDAQPADWSKIRLPSTYREQPQSQEPEKSDVRVSKIKDAAELYIRQLSDGGSMLVESGIPKLDEAIGGGFAFGEMVVIAARPSHGKSMIALQMSHAMTRNGYPVALVSEEMSALALGKRAVQFVSDIPERNWAYQPDDIIEELNQHFSKRAESFIIESCGTVERACEEIEKLVESSGVRVAMVDYAQLLRTKGGSRYEQISAVSSALRMFASRTGVLLIVLAQLNRAIESRQKFEPKMSDIKETGQLEQDADVILFGVWPYRVDQTRDAKTYSIYVAKNRNREIREYNFDCEFNPSRQMLTELAVEAEEWDYSGR